jgi:FAD dependent oxidoreductase
MENNNQPEDPSVNYDIVICGGGVAGLWLLNILSKAGFDVLLLEKAAVGGVQTIASQGMIHGGQRYMIGKNTSSHAEKVAPLPGRWNACLEGQGELDLRGVRVLNETQVMWPTGGRLTKLVLTSASVMLKAKTRKLDICDVPKALAGLKGIPVYELPEKVLDIASLVDVLSAPHRAKIRKGSIDSLSRDGHLTVSGLKIKAQIVICAAGLGNEELLSLLGDDKKSSQRRPLRQLMVKTMPYPLYGHGITTSYKPRVTVTSHPLESGGYVWYLGGSIADDILSLSESDAIAFAKNEMNEIFDHIDWSGKQWATWYGMRAEAYSETGRLPNGPVIQEYGNALVIWPTKLTMAPIMGDQVLSLLADKGVRPKHSKVELPLQSHDFSLPPQASFPWELASWAS